MIFLATETSCFVLITFHLALNVVAQKIILYCIFNSSPNYSILNEIRAKSHWYLKVAIHDFSILCIPEFFSVFPTCSADRFPILNHVFKHDSPGNFIQLGNILFRKQIAANLITDHGGNAKRTFISPNLTFLSRKTTAKKSHSWISSLSQNKNIELPPL